MKYLVPLLSLIIAIGCVHKPESVQVDGRPGHIKQGSTALMRVGMSKEELLSKVGPPATVAADRGKETLYYTEEMPWWNWKRVRVVVVDGKVIEFGQAQNQFMPQ